MDNENEIKKNWEVIKKNIKEEFDLLDTSYRIWIEPLQFYSVEDNIVKIVIPADQSNLLDYITKKYTVYFKVIINGMFNTNYDVVFILEKDVKNVENETPAKSFDSLNNTKYERSNLNSKYKFDTFVVGPNNKLAYSASLAVAESPGEIYNPLFLYGDPGLGKTHLMHSIGHFILDHNPKMRVLYVTSEEFTNEVIESIRNGNASMTKLREKYRTVDVLMVDDVQFIIGKESTQEEFFHTFNVLHEAHKAIIISSDKPPKDMNTLDERFRSRFGWGLTADIQPPDFETRTAILQKNAENIDFKIGNEIIEYIATNVKSNIRELEGALNKIVAFAKLNKKEPNLNLAEEALKDIISPNESKEITPNSIINVVAEHYGIRPDDILSKKRNAEFSMPRQVVMYLCHEMIDGISLMSIARLLNKKDHTTIMHGIDKVSSDIKTNREFANQIETIKKKISP